MFTKKLGTNCRSDSAAVHDPRVAIVPVWGKQPLCVDHLPLCRAFLQPLCNTKFEERFDGWKSCPAGRSLNDPHSSRWATVRVLKGSLYNFWQFWRGFARPRKPKLLVLCFALIVIHSDCCDTVKGYAWMIRYAWKIRYWQVGIKMFNMTMMEM